MESAYLNSTLREVIDRLDVVEIPESRVFEETATTSFVDVNTTEEIGALSDADASDSHTTN